MSAGDDLNVLGQFREWLGESIDDDEFGKFVDAIMERRGHKRQSSWVDGEGKSNDGGGSVLGLSSKRNSGNKGGPGWQYAG